MEQLLQLTQLQLLELEVAVAEVVETYQVDTITLVERVDLVVEVLAVKLDNLELVDQLTLEAVAEAVVQTQEKVVQLAVQV